MNNTYTAVVRQNGKWWIGWIEEIPGVNCQEASRDELLDTLRITLREALGNREISEQEWLHALARNPVFSFLNDPREDIYTLNDGIVFQDELPVISRVREISVLTD